MRRSVPLHAAAWVALGIACAGAAAAQQGIPSGSVTTTQTFPERHTAAAAALDAKRYPYTFSNFVWWSDADLRRQLHSRLPALGDTIVSGSPEQDQIQAALVALLRSKGIEAQVQSIGPSTTLSFLPRAAGAPPMAVEFSVVPPPEIVAGEVDLRQIPPEAAAETDALARITGRPYSRGSFWAAEHEVTAALEDNGYLSAHIHIEPGAPARNAEKWVVPLTIAVEKGPQYHVASVHLDGGPLVQGRDLSRMVALAPGDIARPGGLQRVLAGLRSLYQQQGYADVTFHTEPALDPARALATYDVTTTPGPQYRVRSVEILNLSPAQQGEVRAALGLKPGDLFNLSAVQRVYRALQSSPTLVGQSFNYSYEKNRQAGEVKVALDFHKSN